MEVTELKKSFKEAYGHEADAAYFSPGRANLLANTQTTTEDLYSRAP